MQIRVGGDFEISTQILTSEPICRFENLVLNAQCFTWTDIGRSAILLALLDIEKKTKKRIVHLPTFICDAVKQPFLERDFEIRYYSLGEMLNESEGLPLVGKEEIFLFIHYFGHQNDLVVDWLKNQDKDFFVIEDYVQASLSTFKTNVSDYKVFSFRKFTPQTDGALLISTTPIEADLNQPNIEFLQNQLHGKLIRGWTEESKYFIDVLKNSEESLNNKIVPKAISSISKYVMERLDFSVIQNKRKDNWLYLNELLLKEVMFKGHLTSLYTTLSSDEVPLGYVVRVNTKRDDLRLFLIRKNIFCPIHWQISYALNDKDKNLSESILTIPIDQRIGEREINYIAKCLKEYYGG